MGEHEPVPHRMCGADRLREGVEGVAEAQLSVELFFVVIWSELPDTVESVVQERAPQHRRPNSSPRGWRYGTQLREERSELRDNVVLRRRGEFAPTTLLNVGARHAGHRDVVLATSGEGAPNSGDGDCGLRSDPANRCYFCRSDSSAFDVYPSA